MLAAFKSSGDLIADRRFLYGQALFRDGDFAAAAELFEQAVERAPQWPSAHWLLGKARRESGDRIGAAVAFRDCLRLDPNDMLGASLALAELDAAVTVDAAPGAYVKALFNAYAADFDKALVERLDYTTPQKIAAMVRAARKTEGRAGRALDLGCGTGLAGEAIAADFAWLEGVDLSDGMIEAARAKGVYDRLETADLSQALHSRTEMFDLILAADVLIYFGDLRKTVAAIARRLSNDGLFAFSVEKTADADWTLQSSLRFAHSADYILRMLKAAGLELHAMEEATLRKDRGADVTGLIVVARMPRPLPESLPATGDASLDDAPASVH